MTGAVTPFYLDCDTGIDDALALVYLLNTPTVDLLGVGTVAGNTSARQGAANTAALLGIADRSDIPVAVGAHRSLVGTYGGGDPHYHGRNGIGGVDLPPGRPPMPEDAADLLVRLARTHPGRLHIVAIAPLTNIALALEREPALPDLIASLTIMGGAVWVPGNVTPVAEANVNYDAEAAGIVLRAGFTTQLVPLDVTQNHRLDDTDADLLSSAGAPLHVALGHMLRHYIGAYESDGSRRHTPLHDPLAAAISTGEVMALRIREVEVDVMLDRDLYGRTAVIDTGHGPKISVVVEVSMDAAEVVLQRIIHGSSGP